MEAKKNNEKMSGMRSIRYKLTIIFIAFVLVISIALGYTSFLNARNTVIDELHKGIQAVTMGGAKLVSSRLDTQLTFLKTLAERRILTDDTPLEEKLKTLQAEADRMGYDAIAIVDLNGVARRSDGQVVNVSDREYFIEASKGNLFVSDVLVSKSTGELIFTLAAPIKRNDKVEGVIYAVSDAEELSELIQDLVYGESGSSFIVNSEGINIANTDIELVLNQYNVIEDAKENPELAATADIVENKMLKGETGVGQYFFKGRERIVGYAPIPWTDWSLGVEADLDEALQGVYRLRNFSMLVSLAIAVLGILVAFIVGGSLARPIIGLTGIIERFSNYDLSYDEEDAALNYLKRKDEIGRITNALVKMQRSLAELIKNAMESSEIVGATSQELSASIEEISGNTNNQSSNIHQISSSIEEMSANINIVSNNMQMASQNVSAIAESMNQMEISINDNTIYVQDINHSIGDILNAIEGTNKTINSISDKSKSASQTAESTVELAAEGKHNLDRSVSQMESIQSTISDLSHVIYGLGKSADQIGEITDLIKDIAEQTNLLALNASIEAARAGEHGKGFAVVAQAIGNLAEESSNATKEIANVIKNIQAEIKTAVQSSDKGNEVVASGTCLIQDTSQSLEKIFEAIQLTSQAINEITEEMGLQSKEVNNIFMAANDISDRVSNLMASLEEGAASITEIKNDVDSINELMNEISASMEEQSAASDQISSAINENAAGIQEISLSSNEIAKSSEELAANAQRLVAQVQRFKI